MKLSCLRKPSDMMNLPVLVIPLFQGEKGAEAALSLGAFQKEVELPLSFHDFQGKEGETQLIYSAKQGRLLLLGLGKKKECFSEQIRRAFGAAVAVLRNKKMTEVGFLLPEVDNLPVAYAALEGIGLANYEYGQLRAHTLKERPPLIERVTLAAVSKQEEKELLDLLLILEGVFLARDLVNGNADHVHAGMLCSLALKMASKTLKVDILDRRRLEQEKLGFILAVNQGAERDPALVILEYRGDSQSKKTTALLGKGITYDTGGLNLKPSTGMITMKCDMAGAATVLSVLQTAAKLKLKQNLIGVLAIAENAIGPKSYKLGDVIVGHAGKTVEINDTDAEGRLVLADALSYVQARYKPSCMIDLATLTGGVVVGLGEDVAGLFANDDALAHALEDAGKRTYERVWRLPLVSEYLEKFKSHIADMKNSGGRDGSPIKGALFLQSFVQETPWAHLDIAGPAFFVEPKGYCPSNATGMGVRLLIDFFTHSRDS